MNPTKKKSRVLAIDDEPSMIEWLKILLEHEGYEVRTAMIGTRGDEIFRTWKPDVVVTDMMLPDADGLELLRRFNREFGTTFLLVTHDPQIAERCNRIIEIVDGRVTSDRVRSA